MSLKGYKKKRSFKKTPYPKGKITKGKDLFFGGYVSRFKDFEISKF
jgi:hypothetical protein